MHSTCKFYTWLHTFCTKTHILNLHKSARWLQTQTRGLDSGLAVTGLGLMQLMVEDEETLKGHSKVFRAALNKQVTSSLARSRTKSLTLIKSIQNSWLHPAVLWDKIRNSEEVLFNANNPLGFPTAVQQKRCVRGVYHAPANKHTRTHTNTLFLTPHAGKRRSKKKKKRPNRWSQLLTTEHGGQVDFLASEPKVLKGQTTCRI